MISFVIMAVILNIGCGSMKETISQNKPLSTVSIASNSDLEGNRSAPIDITAACEFHENNILSKCFWPRTPNFQEIIIRDSISLRELGRKAHSRFSLQKQLF